MQMIIGKSVPPIDLKQYYYNQTLFHKKHPVISTVDMIKHSRNDFFFPQDWQILQQIKHLKL